MRLNLVFALATALLFACSSSDSGSDSDGKPPVDALGDLAYDGSGDPDVSIADGEEPADIPAGDLGPDTGFCPGNVTANGFRDNCDGTVTDTRTGLMWLRTSVTGTDFKQLSANCNRDYAGYVGWRLASIDQLRDIIFGCDKTTSGGACGVTEACTLAAGNLANAVAQCSNEACSGCEAKGGPGDNGCFTDELFDDHCNMVISSTKMSKAIAEMKAWYVTFWNGGIEVNQFQPITRSAFGRCVRDPQEP